MQNTKKVVIIYHGDPRKIGGLQHYVMTLSEMLIDNSYDVVLATNGVKDNEIQLSKEIQVQTIKETKMQKMFECSVKQNGNKNTIYIVATDQYDIHSRQNNVLVIQHGIAFDDPMTYSKGIKRFIIVKWGIKVGKILKNIVRFYGINYMVLVDYNYFNWIRTVSYISPKKRMYVIPNFAKEVISKERLIQKLQKRKQIRIIFARRFEDYRGSILFEKVVKRILDEFEDISIDFAGDGSLKQHLLDTFKNEKRVKIFSYLAEDSFKIHSLYDIAIIPTLYSEGTSLSLCEAMGAGCYPIATHVGGITNILIDNFNGTLVSPNEESLYMGIKHSITMKKEQFNQIVMNAWETAKSGFNKKVWEIKWKRALTDIFENIKADK